MRTDGKLRWDQTGRALQPAQATEDQDRGDPLRQDRSPGDACNAHVQPDHKEQIQDHIDDAGQRQKDQRSRRISHGIEDRAAVVVDEVKDRPDKIDPHISDGKGQDPLRRSHEDQCGRSGRYSEDHQ